MQRFDILHAFSITEGSYTLSQVQLCFIFKQKEQVQGYVNQSRVNKQQVQD
jgi:hypothetical protein